MPLCLGGDVMSSLVIFIGGRSACSLNIDFLSELLETSSSDSTVVVVVLKKGESCPPNFSTLPFVNLSLVVCGVSKTWKHAYLVYQTHTSNNLTRAS